MIQKKLDTIKQYKDFKNMQSADFEGLAQEVRDFLINTISKTGGHLGSNLGVVELTIALLYVFDLDKDNLIWDVSHQAYTHKILTGRKDLLKTIRQSDGISGFCSPSESKFDTFGAGHSSTSISAGLGISLANNLNNKNNKVVSIIGDGSLSSGLAFEGLNNSYKANSNFIVILNDNDMSISKPVGGLSYHLSNLFSKQNVNDIRNFSKNVIKSLPEPIQKIAKTTDDLIKNILPDNTFFDKLGFQYFGIIDGHNFDQLITVLKNIKNLKNDKPILLHIATQKGKGYKFAEQAKDKLHGINQFNIKTGLSQNNNNNNYTYSDIIEESIYQIAKKDDKVVTITAAMPSGTGLNKMQTHFPTRVFDVGIAESHAVTFAGGLAIQGIKPVVCIYSTFLQRSYDQLIHDIAIQNLPVLFLLDRAGLVGADGKTHSGAFDIPMISNIPNFKILAPATGEELQNMLCYSIENLNSPIAIRYPKESTEILKKHKIILPTKYMSPYKAEIIKKGSSDVAILSLGTVLHEVLLSYKELKDNFNTIITVVNCKSAKPVDDKTILKLLKKHNKIITIEYCHSGGFSNQVNTIINNYNYSHNKKIIVKNMHIPDIFIEHKTTLEEQYEISGLNADSITKTVLDII